MKTPYFKVVNNKTGGYCFYSVETDCCFVSPLEQVKKYLKRNFKNSYSVYIENCNLNQSIRWLPFST